MSFVKKVGHGIIKGKDVMAGTQSAQSRVKEATSNKPWGPTGAQMSDLARITFHDPSRMTIMRIIWKRLNDHGKNWRHIYKSLLLLDYLVKNGSQGVVKDAVIHLPNIQTLTTYQHIEDDKDVGQSVRERARAIVDLLNDEERLHEEREKAKANRGKYSDSLGSDAPVRTRTGQQQRSRYDDGYPPEYPEDPHDDYARRRPTKTRSDSLSDEEAPAPQPLPVEWHSPRADSGKAKEARGHPDGPSDSDSDSDDDNARRRAAASRTQKPPPDVQDKVKQLKEMFPDIANDAVMRALQRCNYSISDAALDLSRPTARSQHPIQAQPPLQARPPVNEAQLVQAWDTNLRISPGTATPQAIPQQTPASWTTFKQSPIASPALGSQTAAPVLASSPVAGGGMTPQHMQAHAQAQAQAQAQALAQAQAQALLQQQQQQAAAQQLQLLQMQMRQQQQQYQQLLLQQQLQKQQQQLQAQAALQQQQLPSSPPQQPTQQKAYVSPLPPMTTTPLTPATTSNWAAQPAPSPFSSAALLQAQIQQQQQQLQQLQKAQAQASAQQALAENVFAGLIPAGLVGNSVQQPAAPKPTLAQLGAHASFAEALPPTPAHQVARGSASGSASPSLYQPAGGHNPFGVPTSNTATAQPAPQGTPFDSLF